jgi:hypothetical protein
MSTPNTGALLYARKVRVIVDTQLIENLRVQFKVKRTLKKEPNTAEISISNLNENNRALFQQQHQKVILEAGYQNSIARIFSGNSRYIDQVRDGADWITKIQCGDGEINYQYRRASQSFAPGTRVADVVQNIVTALGLTATGMDKVQEISEQFLQGYSAFGLASRELDKLLKNRGFEWSIQDGQLQILPVGAVTPDSIVVISSSSGMIGSPEHGNPERDIPISPDQFVVEGQKKRGPPILKIRCLLQPGLNPGRRVQVIAQGINGIFRIQQVVYSGDTHGGDWLAELECLPNAQ